MPKWCCCMCDFTLMLLTNDSATQARCWEGFEYVYYATAFNFGRICAFVCLLVAFCITLLRWPVIMWPDLSSWGLGLTDVSWILYMCPVTLSSFVLWSCFLLQCFTCLRVPCCILLYPAVSCQCIAYTNVSGCSCWYYLILLSLSCDGTVLLDTHGMHYMVCFGKVKRSFISFISSVTNYFVNIIWGPQN